jgi:nitrate/nitrite transporter NarK
VPWFLQDLSTYGIGIFTPVIIAAAFGASAKEHTVAAVIHNDLLGARGTALVDLGFLVGIACAIALADRWGRIPLQIIGFVGCALGLLLAAAGSLGGQSNLPVIVAGFVLFQFMTNLGPNAQTYLLAGEVFPTPVRGLGAGLAAATGKVGAVLTAFLFPILLADWGTERLLPLLAITSLVGAAITWAYRIETTGKAMDAI